MWGGSLHLSYSPTVVGRWFSQEPERRPVEKREQMTWKRVNKKLKRILKRREIERLKREGQPKLLQNSR
jgi:hypothetical protein